MGTAPAFASTDEAMDMARAALGYLAVADATQLGAATQARCLKMFEQADAIMLSGETTIGRYPVECVRVLDKIATRIEISPFTKPRRDADNLVRLPFLSTPLRALRRARDPERSRDQN